MDFILKTFSKIPILKLPQVNDEENYKVGKGNAF